MAGSSYENGVATVTSTRVKLATVQSEAGGILVQNQGAVAIYLGGPTVTADATATGGYQLAAASSVLVPSIGGQTHDLYAVTTTTAVTAWLQPIFGG